MNLSIVPARILAFIEQQPLFNALDISNTLVMRNLAETALTATLRDLLQSNIPTYRRPISVGRFDIKAETGPVLGKHRVLLFLEKETGQTYTDRDTRDVYPRRKEGSPAVYQSEESQLEVEFTGTSSPYNFYLRSK